MFYYKKNYKVYKVAEGYSDFFFSTLSLLPFQCPQNSNISPKMETNPPPNTYTCKPDVCTLILWIIPPISALQCEFSEQTTSANLS